MRHKGSRAEAGFTLIELMVVVLIIGILIAIALPTFLGARQRAQDKAVQSDMRTALVAALSFYIQSPQSTYSGFNVAEAKAAEPILNWVVATQPTTGTMDIQIANGPNLLLVAKSDNLTFFCLSQVSGNPLTDRGHSTDFTQVDTVAECTGGW